MQRLWFTLLAAAGILSATPARAQDLRAPRLEIGATFSGIVPLVIMEDGPGIVGGVGPRVTVNVSPRFALEGLADVLAGLESYGTTALYQTQLKYALRKARAGRAVSFTVGAAGLAWYYHGPETRVTRPDRSIAVYPAYRRFRVDPPSTFSAGLAREQVFGRHTSSYLAIQGYVGEFGGIALRASVGLSFGIGGYR
jgi:hypothetical protein